MKKADEGIPEASTEYKCLIEACLEYILKENQIPEEQKNDVLNDLYREFPDKISPNQLKAQLEIKYPNQAQKIIKRANEIEKQKVEENKKRIIEEETTEAIQDYIFDESKIKQKLSSAIGTYKDKKEEHFYFGIKLCKEIIKERNGNEFKEQKQDLIIASDDFKLHPITRQWQEENNAYFTEIPLSDNKWSLASLKDFKDGCYKIIEAKELFSNIKKKYEENIYFYDEKFYDIAPIWNIGTYFFPLFEAYPYYNLQGNKGSGKTKVLRLSEQLSFNGVCFVNTTATTLFRFVECDKPTLHLDEVEKLIKDTKAKTDLDDTKELLNSGWQKGAIVPRWEKEKDGKWKLQNFDPYCPKMLASINGIKGALEDRSITCVMIKASKEDSKGDTWIDDNDKFKYIRDDTYSFALANWKQLKNIYCSLRKEVKLSNRDWQMWKPLLSIACLIDNELYKKMCKYAVEITEARSNEDLAEDSWDFKILDAIWQIVKNKTDETEKFELKVTGIKENMEMLPDEKKKISLNYIGQVLYQNGFKKYRKRTGSKGVYYWVTKKEIFELYKHHNYDTLFTLSTLKGDDIDDKNGVNGVEDVV